MNIEPIDYFERMLRIRRVEERLMSLKTEGFVPGSLHLCNGQEAIPVGVVGELRRDDFVTATYRGHGWALAKGADLTAFFAEVMGRESQLAGGRAGSPYLSDRNHSFLGENSIVGAGVPIALGAALSAKLKRTGGVSVVSIGDGATNQGAVHEALNMAAVLAVPLIVMIENNVWSEMVPIREMTRVESLAVRGSSYGIPASTIDGNDPGTVAEVAREAIERARGGGGPTIIEAMTQRIVGHHSGDIQHYRPREDLAQAMYNEPLALFARAAESDPALRVRMDEAERRVADDIAAAVATAKTISTPRPETAQEHVYA